MSQQLASSPPRERPVGRLVAFAQEREAIRRRRASGQRPLTTNPILGDSFCNLRRENDRGTRWITKNWREPNADDPDLWFAMTVARLVNRSETLAELGYPVPWNRRHFLEVMAARGKGEAYGSAYMIHADSKMGRPTPAYQVEVIFEPLWSRRADIRPRRGDTLAAFDAIFRQLQNNKIIEGLGPFYIGQIIADLKYVEPLKSAKDWWTYCVPGPGSQRGLNRILGRAVKASWDEAEWRAEMRRLHQDIALDLEELGIGRLHRQDLNNLLCEWDKYERTRLGEGKPKRKFVPYEDRDRKDRGVLF
jgi:hypothetical protein